LAGAGFARPSAPFGITAVVRVKDEEDWIEPSIRSLAGFADQIVVGDNGSTDATPVLLKRLQEEFPRTLEVLTVPQDDIRALTNRLLARARYRWVVRWDADFVAQTEGPNRISLLKEWLSGLPRRHFLVYLTMVELAGDLWHQDPATARRSDAHLFTRSDALRYIYDPAGYESPKAPAWYAVRRWSLPCFFHVHVKSDRRLFLNGLWKQWLLRREPDGSFPAFVRDFCLTHFGSEDVEGAARRWTDLYVRRLSPYDERSFPALPALLKPCLARPKYRLVYDNGRISGRETVA
jgi:glycosyltransferase involved in cell wall biosynthesis